MLDLTKPIPRNAHGNRLSQTVTSAWAGKQGKAATAASLLALGFTGSGVEAATFTVTNTNDSGAGSLRQAVLDANGAVGTDLIDATGVSGVITLTTGQLAVSDSVTISGPGAATLSVSGNNASRVFYLYNNSSTLDVTISGLTMTQGSAITGEGSGTAGGCLVDFDENLTLNGVTISNCSSAGDGGGLWADGFNMNLQILNSTLTGNTAGGGGGAIYVEDTDGPLLIQHTTISGNQAANNGGGVYFYDPDDNVTIDSSTISGNTAGGNGGGIYLYDTDGGIVTLVNTTISGNTANFAGGGIYFYGPDDPVVIQNSTVSGNTATSGSAGGIYLANSSHGFTITNSIIANNVATTNPDIDGGSSFDIDYSLIEEPGAAAITDNGGNILNTDPQLGALVNNGGPTFTHLPAAASPVVNTGNPAFVAPPATDQRGLARVSGGQIDMGSVELASVSASVDNAAAVAGLAAMLAFFGWRKQRRSV